MINRQISKDSVQTGKNLTVLWKKKRYMLTSLGQHFTPVRLTPKEGTRLGAQGCEVCCEYSSSFHRPFPRILQKYARYLLAIDMRVGVE